MENRRTIKLIIYGALFVLLLTVSIVFHDFFHGYNLRRVLFFPENLKKEISAEFRIVKKMPSHEENIRQFVKELILGPIDINHGRLFSKETGINQLHIIENVLYVDFDEQSFFVPVKNPLSFNESLEVIEENILFNFRYLKDVVFTINGQLI